MPGTIPRQVSVSGEFSINLDRRGYRHIENKMMSIIRQAFFTLIGNLYNEYYFVFIGAIYFFDIIEND